MREVCLIVPCFNEERRLRRDTLLEFVRSRPPASLCLVDDGSSDGTLKTLEALGEDGGTRILVRRLSRNSGKAEAVRQGVLYARSLERYAFLGYWDADLSTPLSQMDLLLGALEAD